MDFHRYSYTIGAHFVPAIENDDVTGLTEGETLALEYFLADLPGIGAFGHWSWGEDEEFDLDEVAGYFGQCIRAEYLQPVGGGKC